ncbi:MAG: hypothetical protein ABSE17_01030 [Candidatus Levyibacteriota bacterium]|jgi:hypothetical protein
MPDAKEQLRQQILLAREQEAKRRSDEATAQAEKAAREAEERARIPESTIIHDLRMEFRDLVLTRIIRPSMDALSDILTEDSSTPWQTAHINEVAHYQVFVPYYYHAALTNDDDRYSVPEHIEDNYSPVDGITLANADTILFAGFIGRSYYPPFTTYNLDRWSRELNNEFDNDSSYCIKFRFGNKRLGCSLADSSYYDDMQIMSSQWSGETTPTMRFLIGEGAPETSGREREVVKAWNTDLSRGQRLTVALAAKFNEGLASFVARQTPEAKRR